MPSVVAVAASAGHQFSKAVQPSITLLAGLGVQGDAHMGETVKHRSRVARDPTQPNLRQVHLLQSELFEELATLGYRVAPGDLGENISTRGLNLLALPTRTVLQVGASARLRITGLRNPCVQIDRFAPGLMQAVLDHATDGALVRKAGVMAVVLEGGIVTAGDRIAVELPGQPHRPLAPVSLFQFRYEPGADGSGCSEARRFVDWGFSVGPPAQSGRLVVFHFLFSCPWRGARGAAGPPHSVA